MINKVEFNNKCEKKLAKFYKKDKESFTRIVKTLKVFKENPDYPALKLHKITGKKIQVWSMFVTRDIRIIFRYIKEGIQLIDIGSHDEVY